MRKKNDEVKRQAGTYRGDRADMVIDCNLPAKPNFNDEIAGSAWDGIVTELSGVGLLSKLDSQILETACLLYSRIRVVAEALRVQGEIVVDAKGDSRLNPLAKCLKDYSNTFDTICNSLGLTPQGRSKMGIVVKKQDKTSDPLQEFLRKGKGNRND